MCVCVGVGVCVCGCVCGCVCVCVCVCVSGWVCGTLSFHLYCIVLGIIRELLQPSTRIQVIKIEAIIIILLHLK